MNRWVIRRKAEVLAAVHGGLVSLEDVCRRYMLTVEEFLSWQYSIDRHGLAGLRTTRIQQYRPGNFPLWPCPAVGSVDPPGRRPNPGGSFPDRRWVVEGGADRRDRPA
jgi:hypothetical protein